MDINTFIATSRHYLESTLRSGEAEFEKEQEVLIDNLDSPAALFGSCSRRIVDKVKKRKSGNLEIWEMENFQMWVCGKVEHGKLAGVEQVSRSSNRACHL